jgi:large subunit ribosomal protein L25
MAEQLTVTAQPRVILGKAVRRLRREGTIPANIYGRGRTSRAVQLEGPELKRLLAANAGSRVIQLRVNGAQEAAMVRHITHEPRSGRVLHIDFMHVVMTEKLRAPVPMRLVGEAPAVRTLGGTLLHMRDALEVECLPRDLPEALELDISPLDSFDATLHAREVPLPAGVTLLDPPDEPVVKVSPPRMVEEEAPAPAAAAEAEEAPAAPTGPEETASEG